MAQDRATPEKRLLELIESPNDRALREIKKKRKRIGFFSLGVLKGSFSFLKERISKGLAKGGPVLDIREINIILTICVFGLIVYLTLNWVNATSKLKEISNLALKIATKEEAKPFSSVSLLKDPSYYSQKVNSRDIFKLGLKATSQDEENGDTIEKVITPKDELITLTEKLILVGVSWSEDPVAMIENTDAKMTYFLKKDEEINKGIKIKQIFMDKVILEYKGAEVELKL